MKILPSPLTFYDIDVFEKSTFSHQYTVRSLVNLKSFPPTFQFWVHIMRGDFLQSVGALCYLSIFFGISSNLFHLTRVVSAKSLLYQVVTFVFMFSYLLSDTLCGVLLVPKFYL